MMGIHHAISNITNYDTLFRVFGSERIGVLSFLLSEVRNSIFDEYYVFSSETCKLAKYFYNI